MTTCDDGADQALAVARRRRVVGCVDPGQRGGQRLRSHVEPQSLGDAGVSSSVATPLAFVRTVDGTPLAPRAASRSSTSGSALPAADRTRIVAVTSVPAVSRSGSDVWMR